MRPMRQTSAWCARAGARLICDRPRRAAYNDAERMPRTRVRQRASGGRETVRHCASPRAPLNGRGAGRKPSESGVLCVAVVDIARPSAVGRRAVGRRSIRAHIRAQTSFARVKATSSGRGGWREPPDVVVNWYRIPESPHRSGGVRLSTDDPVSSGQVQPGPAGYRVRIRVQTGGDQV